jgi:maltooligosyltrehalose trehalohydrolase
MGWDPDLVPDPQAESTFLDSKLDWRELLEGEHAEMLRLYRQLAILRRTRAELTDPRFNRNAVDFDDDQKWLLVDRSGLRIAVNISDETRTIPLAEPAGSLLLTTQAGPEVDGDQLSLPPHTAVVIAPAGE